MTGMEMLLLLASHPMVAPDQALGKQADSKLVTTKEGGVTDIVVDTVGVSDKFGQGEFVKEVKSS